MKTLITLTMTALAIAGLGTAGTADFEDAMASEAAYCERVLAGTHTDYLQLGGVCRDRY